MPDPTERLPDAELKGVPEPSAAGPDPEGHGPTDTDEHDVVPAGIAERLAEAEERLAEVENLPHTAAVDPDQAVHAARALAVAEQLAYRVVFLEAALTRVTREMVSRGIFPRNYEDQLIGEVEADIDNIGDRVNVGSDSEGRAGLIAAYLAPYSDRSE
jgi:hypothetical protein